MPVMIDMEMPKYCMACQFGYLEPGIRLVGCMATHKMTNIIEERPPYCPLKEVKEDIHNDADIAMSYINE